MRAACVLTVAACAAACGCGSKPSSTPSSAPRPAAAAVAPTKAIPTIKSVTPDTVLVRGGHAAGGTYSVEYEIANAAVVSEAELTVHAPGVGNVQKLAVSPQDRGTLTFDLDTSTDLGPTIALRAQCPGGETEPYLLGTERPAYGTPTESGLRITSVASDRINLDGAYMRAGGEISEGAGVPVTIFGSELTADCKPLATVDGREVELKNVWSKKGQIKALLLYRDFGTRYVSSRYLEVQLIVRGQGFATVNIAHVKFVE